MKPYSPNRTLLALALLVGSSISFLVPATSQAATSIPVGAARTKKMIVGFPDVRTTQTGSAGILAKTITETVKSDLTFMDMFTFMEKSGFPEKYDAEGLTPDKFKMAGWTGVHVEFLIKSALTLEGGNLALEAYVYDTFGNKQILAKKYVATTGEAKTLAHTFANQIVEAITPGPGIFLTKLAMVCDRTGQKEIYTMNFDGTDVKQITHHRSTAIAPAWSPDGSKIAYSLFFKHKDNVKNIDLWEFNFRTETTRRISNRKGINSGACYTPDGKKLALTMSFLGNPEIFLLDPDAGTTSRLTHSLGFEVDPVFSPNGKEIAFVSNRTGMPMVFKMNADGSNQQRLTYAGRYNATPTWSPTNSKIGFAGWIDGRFDIFIMNPDGSTIERLTKDQGNNEDPFFSPDGNFLAFSSNRTGQQNIYVMNVDGTYVKRLTFGMGNCTAPKWSNPPVKK